MREQSSLKKRLLLLALSTVAVVWSGAATFVYFDAREEFDEVLDAIWHRRGVAVASRHESPNWRAARRCCTMRAGRG
jgi:hypothetical protein